jgi:hypothetical protein
VSDNAATTHDTNDNSRDFFKSGVLLTVGWCFKSLLDNLFKQKRKFKNGEGFPQQCYIDALKKMTPKHVADANECTLPRFFSLYNKGYLKVLDPKVWSFAEMLILKIHQASLNMDSSIVWRTKMSVAEDPVLRELFWTTCGLFDCTGDVPEWLFTSIVQKCSNAVVCRKIKEKQNTEVTKNKALLNTTRAHIKGAKQASKTSNSKKTQAQLVQHQNAH